MSNKMYKVLADISAIIFIVCMAVLCCLNPSDNATVTDILKVYGMLLLGMVVSGFFYTYFDRRRKTMIKSMKRKKERNMKYYRAGE